MFRNHQPGRVTTASRSVAGALCDGPQGQRMDSEGQLMVEIPVTGALAEYRGRRPPIVFGGDDWVALRAARGSDMPDGFAFGESSVGSGTTNHG
jgi:hypothetical protein